jgi:hypothetical protein
MNGKRKAIAYTRNEETRNQNAPYEIKFGGWIRAVADAKAGGIDSIIISDPWVIGDTYEEIVKSLSRLAGSGVALEIVQRDADVRDN